MKQPPGTYCVTPIGLGKSGIGANTKPTVPAEHGSPCSWSGGLRSAAYLCIVSLQVSCLHGYCEPTGAHLEIQESQTPALRGTVRWALWQMAVIPKTEFLPLTLRVKKGFHAQQVVWVSICQHIINTRPTFQPVFVITIKCHIVILSTQQTDWWKVNTFSNIFLSFQVSSSDTSPFHFWVSTWESGVSAHWKCHQSNDLYIVQKMFKSK